MAIATTDSLQDTISRLAHMPPSPNPVVSLFVNTRPETSGRPHFMAYVKKAFSDRIRSFPERSEARARLEADRDRVEELLERDLEPAGRSMAIYASGADGLWESHVFGALFDEDRLVVGPVPHLYPLVKLADQAPLYAVCVVDVNHSRIVTCGLGEVLTERDFENPEPIDRTRVAGWAEIRYQARIDDHIRRNAREVAERLADLVQRNGQIGFVILAGDEPFLSDVRNVLPPAVVEKVVDVERIPMEVGAQEILRRTVQVVRDVEARQSRELAATVIDRFRSGGLAVAGLEPTIEALNQGQIDVLLLAESFEDGAGWQCAECRVLGITPVPKACPFCQAPVPETVDLREAMVRRAERIGRHVEIVEAHAELEALDGVGALLRFRL